MDGTTREIIVRMQQGDEDAFSRLFRMYTSSHCIRGIFGCSIGKYLSAKYEFLPPDPRESDRHIKSRAPL